MLAFPGLSRSESSWKHGAEEEGAGLPARTIYKDAALCFDGAVLAQKEPGASGVDLFGSPGDAPGADPCGHCRLWLMGLSSFFLLFFSASGSELGRRESEQGRLAGYGTWPENLFSSHAPRGPTWRIVVLRLVGERRVPWPRANRFARSLGCFLFFPWRANRECAWQKSEWPSFGLFCGPSEDGRCGGLRRSWYGGSGTRSWAMRWPWTALRG